MLKGGFTVSGHAVNFPKYLVFGKPGRGKVIRRDIKCH